jgi:hypothetical protein
MTNLHVEQEKLAGLSLLVAMCKLTYLDFQFNVLGEFPVLGSIFLMNQACMHSHILMHPTQYNFDNLICMQALSSYNYSA